MILIAILVIGVVGWAGLSVFSAEDISVPELDAANSAHSADAAGSSSTSSFSHTAARQHETYTHLVTSTSRRKYAVCVSGENGERLLRSNTINRLRLQAVVGPDTDLFVYVVTKQIITSGVDKSNNEQTASSSSVFSIQALRDLYGDWLRSFVVTNGYDLREEATSLARCVYVTLTPDNQSP